MDEAAFAALDALVALRRRFADEGLVALFAQSGIPPRPPLFTDLFHTPRVRPLPRRGGRLLEGVRVLRAGFRRRRPKSGGVDGYVRRTLLRHPAADEHPAEQL